MAKKLNSRWLLDRATEFEVWSDRYRPSESVHVRKCIGYKLPKESMWKVTWGGATLDHDGNWEMEPIPSDRDAAYYARCRFETLEEAWEAAEIATRDPNWRKTEWAKT